MDIYEYLKMDHKKIEKLFQLYKTASTDNNKLEIVILLKKELTVHADSEANTFYRALKEHSQSEDEELHGEEEHYEIKSKLEEISNITIVDYILDKKIIELKKLVDEHVADEEGKIFNIALKTFSDKDAWILKEQMHSYKEKILNDVMTIKVQ